MDKNQEFYKNKKEYQDACVPVRERMLNYLIKENFLSEFSTEEEKLQVLENLGITQKLQILQNLVDNKIDISQLGSYVTETELLRRLNDLKPKNEKSKGYYSSYEDLISNNPVNSFGDWAIVNVEGTWFIYKFGEHGWEQSETYDISIDLSEYAKLSDLALLQTLLVSGVNIKTINGQSILGEGNIEIQGSNGSAEIDLSGYVTKQELYNIQNPLKVTVQVSPSLIEYDGEAHSVNVTVIARKGGTLVEPSSIQLSYKGITTNILGLHIAQVQDKGVTTFTATCTYGEEEETASNSVNLVLPTYIGFDSAETAQDLDMSKLLKRVKSNIQMTESLQNTVAGNYLWIISPYPVNNVATDPGFTYKVRMLAIENNTGLYYYRSSSAIDISHLTYYIK